MKINVFIQLLDEKGRLQKSDRNRFEEKLDKALSQFSDGEVEQDLHYKLSLSDSNSQKRKAFEIRDQNQDFRNPLREDSTQIPKALSDVSEFSLARIEKALKGAESVSSFALRKAHSQPDRHQVLKVLS